MTMRINYQTIGRDALRHLHQLRSTAATTASIPPALQALVELRVSQINGCAYCCDLHAHEARKAGVNQQVLDVLACWREAPALFSEPTRAALAWAEAMTGIPGAGSPDDTAFQELGRHYADEEIVALSILVAAMNAYNRLAVSFRNEPVARAGSNVA